MTVEADRGAPLDTCWSFYFQSATAGVLFLDRQGDTSLPKRH